MNSDLKEEGSSSSESSSPVKEAEPTKPLVEKQQNGRKTPDNGLNTSDSSVNVSNNLVDLKSEFNFIKNKIIQIESETRDILRLVKIFPIYFEGIFSTNFLFSISKTAIKKINQESKISS